MFYPIAPTGVSACFLKVNMDGTAVLYLGTTDIGQGSVTIMAQIASESLGISVDRVSVVSGDSKLTPYDRGPVGSRTTYATGNAVINACNEAKETILLAGSRILEVDPHGLILRDDRVYIECFEEVSVSIAEAVIYAFNKLGTAVLGKGSFNPYLRPISKDTGHGKQYATHVFATQIAVVDVDDETGAFELKQIYAVHDCGVAINPMLVHGQIHGGVGMGVGFACYEEVVLQKGKVRNNQFTDYIVPTAGDVPPIISDYMERAEPTGPYGAKGVGEPAILPTAPAIANAVYDAVGVWVLDLPITPEKICMALREKKMVKAEK
jgi:CO/xanthine dehydrogenase Mo-binding subunit